MDVALIRWPSDEDLRTELAEQGHPRLLLVAPDADPPVCTDLAEDWVRLPVSRADRTARIRMIESRMGDDQGVTPSLDADGMLVYGGRSARLSPIQADLLSPMIERYGAVVSRDSLMAAVWPGSHAPGNTLDVTVSRLRRQLRPLGLRIRTVRARGYLLTGEAPSQRSSSPA
ncbi:MAG: winged helix-turn-helix domain-containing protein [Acidimicrobiia bacterium]|jgi:DNA-binding response OmpR family regulator